MIFRDSFVDVNMIITIAVVHTPSLERFNPFDEPFSESSVQRVEIMNMEITFSGKILLASKM